MKKILFQNKIYVKKSPTHGYGVFAGKRIKKGEIIEECYFLITRGKDKALEDYYFDADGKYGLPTGYGIIYNHADEDNCEYHVNTKRRLMTYKAIKNIKKDEEIFVSYGEDWFGSRNKKAKK